MEIDELFDLPAHPLLVHVPIVLVPLALLAALVALVPLARRPAALAAAALAVVGGVGAFLATGAGEKLEDRVRETELVEEHAESGEAVEVPAIGQLADRPRQRQRRGQHDRRRRCRSYVAGGPGNDTITGSTYGESFDGDDGVDTVSYAGRAAAVSVNLATGDGGSGSEHDDLIAIEGATGGDGADTLTGDGAMNILAGGPNNETLSGTGEADTLIGGVGTSRRPASTRSSSRSDRASPYGLGFSVRVVRLRVVRLRVDGLGWGMRSTSSRMACTVPSATTSTCGVLA
jgi:hypothetical protein